MNNADSQINRQITNQNGIVMTIKYKLSQLELDLSQAHVWVENSNNILSHLKRPRVEIYILGLDLSL